MRVARLIHAPLALLLAAPLIAREAHASCTLPPGCTPIALEVPAGDAAVLSMAQCKVQQFFCANTDVAAGGMSVVVRHAGTTSYLPAGNAVLAVGGVPATPVDRYNTRFAIASITKTFTAALALDAQATSEARPGTPQLDMNHLLDAAPYLPNPLCDSQTGTCQSLPAPGSTVRLVDLASYWSGLPASEPDWVSRADGCASGSGRTTWGLCTNVVYGPLFDCPHCVAPGARYLYSSYGFEVLGAVATNYFAEADGFTGQDYWSALEYNVTGLLDLNETELRVLFDPTGATTPDMAHGYDLSGPMDITLTAPVRTRTDVGLPAGALWSTPYEMGTWMQFNLDDLPGVTGLLADLPPLLQTQVVMPVDTATRTFCTSAGSNEGSTPMGTSDDADQGQGYAWFFAYRKVTNKNGQCMRLMLKDGDLDGFHTFVGLLPATKDGITIMANFDTDTSQIDALGVAILQALQTL